MIDNLEPSLRFTLSFVQDFIGGGSPSTGILSTRGSPARILMSIIAFLSILGTEFFGLALCGREGSDGSDSPALLTALTLNS